MNTLFNSQFLAKFIKNCLISIIGILIILLVIYTILFIKDGFVVKFHIDSHLKYLFRSILIMVIGIFFHTIIVSISEDNDVKKNS